MQKSNETVSVPCIDLKINLTLHYRCCPASKVFNVSKDGNGTWIRGADNYYTKLYEKIVCPGEEYIGTRECKDGSYEEYLLESKLYTFSVDGTKLTIKNNCDLDAEAKVIDKLTDNFCVRVLIFQYMFEISSFNAKYMAVM